MIIRRSQVEEYIYEPRCAQNEMMDYEQVHIITCWMPSSVCRAHLYGRIGVLMLSCHLFPMVQYYIAGVRTLSSGQSCFLRSELRQFLLRRT